MEIMVMKTKRHSRSRPTIMFLVADDYRQVAAFFFMGRNMMMMMNGGKTTLLATVQYLLFTDPDTVLYTHRDCVSATV
jgi:hypothetical protein